MKIGWKIYAKIGAVIATLNYLWNFWLFKFAGDQVVFNIIWFSYETIFWIVIASPLFYFGWRKENADIKTS